MFWHAGLSTASSLGSSLRPGECCNSVFHPHLSYTEYHVGLGLSLFGVCSAVFVHGGSAYMSLIKIPSQHARFSSHKDDASANARVCACASLTAAQSPHPDRVTGYCSGACRRTPSWTRSPAASGSRVTSRTMRAGRCAPAQGLPCQTCHCMPCAPGASADASHQW